MIGILIQKQKMHTFHVMGSKIMRPGAREIKYDYGINLQNIYLVNDVNGRFIIYGFDIISSAISFDIISKTSEGLEIKGAKNYICDAFIEEDIVYVLVECGNIYTIDRKTYECELVEQIPLVELSKNDDRSFTFYKDDCEDFVISSNARMIYPQQAEYHINYESPKFAWPGMLVSELTKATLDLNTMLPHNAIHMVESVDQGVVLGRFIKSNEKIMLFKNGQTKKLEDFKINKVISLGDGVYLCFYIDRDFKVKKEMVITSDEYYGEDEVVEDNVVGSF